jgi:hypothetical protein
MPASAIATSTTSGGAPKHRERGTGGAQRADQKRALAADDHHAELRRQRRAERGENERRGAGQRVLPGEPGAERALVHIEIEIERVLPERRDEDAEQHQRGQQGQHGDDDIFRRAAELTDKRGQAKEFAQPRLHNGCADIGLHEVAPMTPSTR